MAKRGGKVHIAVTRRHYKGTEYKTTLLRRSYRENGKVRNETVGNLSHLEDWMIDGLRAMLAGRRLVDLDDEFEIVRSLPHGHVAAVLGVLGELDVERLISRERCRERDLCVAMIVQQVLRPGSKLAHTRRYAKTTLGEELELGEVTEAELLSAMDWLLERQERIEKTLAKRHLSGEGFVLYDLSSSYMEGRCCPLAKLGYSRDNVKGKRQITYGLTCSPEGRPVAIAVHAGNITDQQTLPDAARAVTQRFGIEHVVLVGDRGMITQAHAQTLTEQGIEFITALKAVQVRGLVNSGDLQLSLFDQTNLAEITSELYPAERLIVCRNPAVATERARKRDSMLQATETELAKVKKMVDGERGTLRNAPAGKIGERAGKIINKYKMAKHFELDISDGSLLRAVQFGHARAELDEHRGVGYERRSKSTACVPPAGVAAPSAGVKRRPARPRPWSVVAALDPQPPCAAGWQGTSCPEGTTAGRTATAAAAADRAAVRRSDRPPAPTARSLSGRTATPTRGRRA